MNIIHYGSLNNEEIINKYTNININVLDYKETIILNKINILILNVENTKKTALIMDKLTDCLNKNFYVDKKILILLNITNNVLIQKFIKNNYMQLSLNNLIIITTNNINNIINELRNSFHLIRSKNKIIKYKNEPMIEFVNQVYDICDSYLDGMDLMKIKKIKEISYKICKYSIPIKLLIEELLDRFISNPKYTRLIKLKIVKLLAETEYNINKSYRILIHVENMIINLYYTMIIAYQ